jgi:hypothetical protein
MNVLGLSTNLEVWFIADLRRQAIAHHRVVFNQKNA